MIAPIHQIQPVTVADIETKCQRYEQSSSELEQLIADLESDLETVKQKHLRPIKRKAADVAVLEAELHAAVESAPHLFTKPRTLTAHGIKVGLAASAGRLDFDDEANVIRLIKRLRKDDAELLIRTTESLNKDALKALDSENLSRLGCRIVDAGDQVVVKRVAGEVEKLINKLIGKLVEAMVANE